MVRVTFIWSKMGTFFMSSDQEGECKYLIEDERLQFLELARQAENEQRTFCLMLYYTGARISEVLNMTYGDIDNVGLYITIESLKKRRKGIFRRIPLPNNFLDDTDGT